ncbi:MAG: GyrI-like domain-containing protein [Dehalococcoidales bacterium]|nr:GyrI-like domain-containing protein [Dehalococcoidales bacterium]
MNNSIDVKIKDIQPMTVAFIKIKGNFSQIPTTFQKLYDCITRKGYKPTGPAIAAYYNIPGEVPDEQLTWELRSRLSGDIAEAVPDAEGFGVKKIDAVKMATTKFKGPYENIEPVHGALNTWILINDYEINGPLEELYYNDPTVTREAPITEIRYPVRKK